MKRWIISFLLVLCIMISATVGVSDAFGILETIPKQGESIALDGYIEIQFTEELSEENLDQMVFVETKEGERISCNVVKSQDDGKILQLFPKAPLENDKEYHVILFQNLKSQSGKILGEDVELVYLAKGEMKVSGQLPIYLAGVILVAILVVVGLLKTTGRRR